MKYAGIIENDVVNGEGVCVSFFTQGCPHRCKGCFNPETWNFNGGKEVTIEELSAKIFNAISKNGIQRNFSILGGEPLCEENIENVTMLITAVKSKFPDTKILIWTGYYIEDIPFSVAWDTIRFQVDYIIDGPYLEEERDITLKWRGSKNQRILTKEKICDIINHKGE